LKQEISEAGLVRARLSIFSPLSATIPLLDVGDKLPNIRGATGLAAMRSSRDLVVKSREPFREMAPGAR
jgi:hypothetical protein